jgi:hypothetical protein
MELYEAIFADSAGGVADTVHVLVDDFDDRRHLWGPVVWQPRVDDAGEPVYPQQGDPALIAESRTGEVWVLAWRPA